MKDKNLKKKIIMQTTKCTISSNNFKTTFTKSLICKFSHKTMFLSNNNYSINEMLTYYQYMKTQINIYGDIKAYIMTK